MLVNGQHAQIDDLVAIGRGFRCVNRWIIRRGDLCFQMDGERSVLQPFWQFDHQKVGRLFRGLRRCEMQQLLCSRRRRGLRTPASRLLSFARLSSA
jgi:hypothetical protein